MLDCSGRLWIDLLFVKLSGIECSLSQGEALSDRGKEEWECGLLSLDYFA